MQPIAKIEPWHPVNNPECTNCHGLARPVRSKKKPSSCGPVFIVLSPSAALRRRLINLIHDSRLPQNEFALSVLGVDEVTLYRYLNGAKIPRSKAIQIRSIEHVERKATVMHVIYRTTPERDRWDAMFRRRLRMKRPQTLHMQGCL